MSTPPGSRLARVLLAIEAFSRKRPRSVLLGALVVGILGTLLSSTLTLQTDVMDLLPQEEPEVREFREAARTFGALDVFPIVLDAAEGQAAEDYEEFADRLAARLRENPAVASVDARLDPSAPFVTWLQERLPLLLQPGELDELATLVADEEIRATVGDDRRLLALASAPEVRELIVRDPLRLSPLLLRRFAAASGGGSDMSWTGYVTSKDGRALLVLVRPSRPAQDVASAKLLVASVREALDATRAEMAELDPELPAPRVLLGGRYAVSVEDSSLILTDIAFTMTFSFLGVVGLYFFCYRRLAAILYSVLPLMLGQCLTFTLARLVVGSLNSATATSAALLMGLGTDFTIVMYARYVEERRAGGSLEESSRKMMGEAALGVYTGAITSAGTFGALMVTAFVGLRQFGFLVGSGILLCLACIVVLLPALVSAFEGGQRAKPARLYVHSFGFERLIPLARRHPWPVLLLSAALTAVAVPFALQLQLSESVQDLRSDQNAGVKGQEEIFRRFGSGQNFTLVVTRGADEADVERRARAVEGRLQDLARGGVLDRVEGFASLVPDIDQQRQVMERLAAGGSTFDPERVEASLRAALVGEGFRESAFEDAISGVTRALRPASLVTAAALTEVGGGDLVSRYRRSDGEGFAAVSHVFGGDPDALIAAVQAVDPATAVTSVQLLSRALKSTLRRDVLLCLGLGFFIVAVLLAIDFRSIEMALLALVQLTVGLTWMLGAMWACDVSLTMVNAFAAALLLGVGIDYGIHILHRLRGQDAGHAEAVMETGKAVAMAAMTNVVGFGVLLFSKYPGLRGLGVAAVMGSIGCLITSLTTMPALERVLAQRRERAGGSAAS